MIHRLSESKSDVVCKLTDFGFSTKYCSHNPPKDFCGSLSFIAPEILNHQSQDYKVDVWAVGVMLYEMLVGGLPF